MCRNVLGLDVVILLNLNLDKQKNSQFGEKEIMMSEFLNNL